MEKDSRKNQKIHKNVGLFKSTIERKTRIKIREKENRLGRSLTREEKAKLRHISGSVRRIWRKPRQPLFTNTERAPTSKQRFQQSV